MFAKRMLLIAVAAALFAVTTGCARHRCCRNSDVSYAPPPCNTCPP
jgi:hypothetical protein